MQRRKKSPSRPVRPARPSVPPAWGIPAACLVILLAGIAAYSNSFAGPFVFDGKPSILMNEAIRRLWPLSHFITEAPPSSTVDGRPVLHLSYAIDYQFSGLEVQGYHRTNLVIHLLAGLLLFGLVRRTSLPFRTPGQALLLALGIALFWVLHPLHTNVVTYINQRAESLMGLWYLLTLYAALRSAQARSAGQRHTWTLLSILACWLGAGTKEVIVSAPLMVMLYDRAFLFPTWRACRRSRWRLYLGLLGSWLPLGILVWMTQNRGGVAGFGSGMGVLEYALSQAYYLMVYVKLCVWPHPLIFYYGRDAVQDWHLILPGLLVVAGLLLATLLAWCRWPWAGFLGTWFFATLAPSSSIVPITTQIAAEHRLYLALAAVISLVVLGLERCSVARLPQPWRRPLRVLPPVAAVALLLGLTTYRRNRVYDSELALWQDTVAKLPNNYAIWDNLGYAYRLVGDFKRAMEAINQGIAIRDDYANLYDERAHVYEQLQKLPEAMQDYNQALELDPNLRSARYRRAVLFLQLQRYAEAESDLNTLLTIDPDWSGSLHFKRAHVRMHLGRFAEAQSDLNVVRARNPGVWRQIDQATMLLQTLRGAKN